MKEMKPTPKIDASEKPDKNKIVLFKTIGVLLPFLILALLELSLNLFNYGNNLDLFLEFPGNKDFLVFNTHASKKYFIDPAFATTGNRELFKKKKDENTFRVFVLGESTTIGYPYFHNGSFHRWLQYRLMHNFPDKNFEIINLSLTAVNSYTIRGFAEEVSAYEPDAVLVYVGHNEYYGALGVGSTQSIGGHPSVVKLILELRQLRITQLMTNLYQKITRPFVQKEIDLDKTRMGLMVASQQISYQSELYKRGVEQFKSNITETLEIFQKKDIPVFISSLVSNEKDLPPFVSVPLNETGSNEFSTKYNQGLKALANNDSLAALNYFNKANEIFAGHAMCNFHIAELAYSYADFIKAKAYFSKAKELDELRFRAPDELNETITQLCNQYANTHLVDSKSKFESYSDNQIIGESLMVDHVHPNLKGYALISDAFYESMKTEKMFSFDQENEMTFDELVKEMPISVIDSLAGDFRIYNLKGRWPYNDPRYLKELVLTTKEEELAHGMATKKIDWQVAHKKLYDYYVGNHQLQKVREITEAMVLEYPLDPVYYEKAAMLCGELKDYKKAVFYFKKSFELAPTFEKAKYLFVILLKMDQPAESIPFLNYAIANNNNKLNLQPIKTSVEKVVQLQNELEFNPSDLERLTLIANAYFKMDNRDGVLKYVDRILKIDADNSEALALRKQLLPQNHGR